MQELLFDPLKISVLASFTGGIGGYSRRVGLEKVVGPAGSGSLEKRILTLLGDWIGRPGRSRTCNPRIRNPMLYPLELRALERRFCRAIISYRYPGAERESACPY